MSMQQPILGWWSLIALADRFDLGVAVARTVVVDADGDVELLDQLVQTVEGRRDPGSAERYSSPRALANSKMRRLASVILAEVDDAVAGERHAGRFASSSLEGLASVRSASMGTWAGYDSQ